EPGADAAVGEPAGFADESRACDRGGYRRLCGTAALQAADAAMSVVVVVIGLYGALSAAKYHERANYHLSQAHALTRALVQSGELPGNQAVLDESRRDHYQQYPRLARIRLHWLWTGLHLGVAAYGVVLTVVTRVVS